LETNSNLISIVRLINQRIAVSEFKTAKEIVSRMGAMKATHIELGLTESLITKTTGIIEKHNN
jgi:hypothetical protein